MRSHRHGLIVLVVVAAAGALFASKIVGTGARVETIEAAANIGDGATAGPAANGADKGPAAASKIIGNANTTPN